MEIIRRQIILAILMALMVLTVFGVSVTAQELQNQTKDQQKSQISNNINSAQTNLQQSSSTSGGNNSTPTNISNQTSNPVVNSTNSTNATVPILNQTSNSTQTNGTEPSSNQTLNNTNSTNSTDANTVLRNVIDQIMAPVLSDANVIRANPTQQSLNPLLNDLNSALNQIQQLTIRININI